jgi:hypothetical protein
MWSVAPALSIDTEQRRLSYPGRGSHHNGLVPRSTSSTALSLVSSLPGTDTRSSSLHLVPTTPPTSCTPKRPRLARCLSSLPPALRADRFVTAEYGRRHLCRPHQDTAAPRFVRQRAGLGFMPSRSPDRRRNLDTKASVGRPESRASSTSSAIPRARIAISETIH